MKLLYITYINLDDLPTSGSSVRPLKMREAFESLGIDVRTFGGINNNIILRKRTIKEIRALLRDWIPDACYIEPPSGPMFYYGDIEIIKYLHRKRIPISIFYRDAYWKYPEYSIEKKLTLIEKIKQFIIKQMQVFQWHVFKNNINIIYFPSLSMAKEFDCQQKSVLPPGGFVTKAIEKSNVSNPLQFIFVGGAARNYGTFLTIDSFQKLNDNVVKAKLLYVCPADQWETLGIDKTLYSDWLEVIHTSGDQNLQPLYEKADVALLIAPRTYYRDFAVPIKIYEYISYLKPILVTDCIETARIIRENQVGWVTKDDVESVVQKLEELCSNHDMILQVRNHMLEVRSNNLWSSRAEKVIRELEMIQVK